MRDEVLLAIVSVAVLVACGSDRQSEAILSSPSPVPPASPASRLLLRDDFLGAELDETLWRLPEGYGTFLGRTQLRPPSERLKLSGGELRLAVDTHNPTALRPGDSFWGSEIVTRRSFAPGNGLIFMARVRFVDAVPGLVGSLFSYVSDGRTHDEIDFELLSSGGKTLTNFFAGEPFSAAGRPAFVANGSPTDFRTFEINWFPDRVVWKIDGRPVREEAVRLTTAMSIRLNFWAPSADFAEAYDSQLQPANNARENKTYQYAVDFVEIRAID